MADGTEVVDTHHFSPAPAGIAVAVGIGQDNGSRTCQGRRDPEPVPQLRAGVEAKVFPSDDGRPVPQSDEGRQRNLSHRDGYVDENVGPQFPDQAA